MPVNLDFETFSEAGYYWDGRSWHGANGGSQRGLNAVGSAVYAEHPSTEVLVACWSVDGAPVESWVPGMPPPASLLEAVRRGELVTAWNSLFEFLIWNHVGVRLYGWPVLPLEQTRDTMAQARGFGLPGKLEVAAKAIGRELKLPGKALLNRFSVPRQPTKNMPHRRNYLGDDPERAQELYTYCAQDVRAESSIGRAVPHLNAHELDVWKLDQWINATGVAVDRRAIDDCRAIVAGVEAQLTEELTRITGGAVDSPGQRDRILAFLATRDCRPPDLTADTVNGYLTLEGLDPWARRVLEIRHDLSSASVKKLQAMHRMTCRDGRIRGLFSYSGAERTGRWSGSGVQPHNLPRGSAEVARCLGCKETQGATRTACYLCHGPLAPAKWSYKVALQALEGFQDRNVSAAVERWGDVFPVIGGSLRSLFVAADGYDFVASDYRAIEAVVLAALAGEEWRLEVFRTHGKIYELSASKITGIPFQEYLDYKARTGDHHPTRQSIGKIAELACLGGETPVLTDSGWKPMAQVTTDDLVHDGVEWVRHSGVVSRGVRGTIDACGVVATPDHKFYAGENRWVTTADFVENIHSRNQVLDTASSLLSGATMRRGTRASSAGALAGLSRLLFSVTFERAPPLAATRAQRKKLAARRQFMPTSVPTGGTGVAFSEGCTQQSRAAPIPLLCSILSMEEEASRFAGHGSRINASGSRTFSPSLVGTTQKRRLIGSTMTGDTNPEISDLSRIANSRTISVRRSGLSTAARGCRPQSFIGNTLRTSRTRLRSSTRFVGGKRPSKSSSVREAEVFDVIDAGPRSRFVILTDVGPVIAHNSGYGGSIGAWKNFGADEHLTDDEILANVKRWRQESPMIRNMWYGLERAAVRAIQCPRSVSAYREIRYWYDGHTLRCVLPSGRCLVYHSPELVPDVTPWGDPTYRIYFWGYNTNPKFGGVGWVRMDTYGGKLTENVVQAVSRDILAHGLLNVARAGYRPVLHVHDEIVCEEPHGRGSVEELEALMGDLPTWARGWPVIAQGGYRDRAYRKG